MVQGRTLYRHRAKQQPRAQNIWKKVVSSNQTYFLPHGRQDGKRYTVKTQNNHLQRLNTFFRWCLREGYAQDNPVLSYWKRLDQQQPRRRKRAKPRRDFLMPSEMQRWGAEVHLDAQVRVLDSGGKLWSRAYVRDMAELACCTGLRESELCNLNQEHVRLRCFDTDRGTLPLSGQVRVAEYGYRDFSDENS